MQLPSGVSSVEVTPLSIKELDREDLVFIIAQDRRALFCGRRDYGGLGEGRAAERARELLLRKI